MAEELQHLIDKIQKEAIESSEQKAEEILSSAKLKAAEIIKKAEEDAKQKLEKADRDAEAYTQRSIRTLEQAARDLLITVGQGVENILGDIVSAAVEESMSVEVMEKMLITMAEACAQSAGDTRIELLVSPKDKEELVKFLADRYRQKLIKGIELHTDNEIIAGFKVSLVEDYVYHDFTKEAIAESLGNFLRPELARIVHRAAREGSDPSTASAGDRKDKKAKKSKE